MPFDTRRIRAIIFDADGNQNDTAEKPAPLFQGGGFFTVLRAYQTLPRPSVLGCPRDGSESERMCDGGRYPHRYSVRQSGRGADGRRAVRLWRPRELVRAGADLVLHHPIDLIDVLLKEESLNAET